MTIARFLTLSCASVALAACSQGYGDVASASSPPATAAAESPVQDINALFDSYDEAQLALSPLGKAYRGIRDEDYGRWGDFSAEGERKDYELLQRTAQDMRDRYDLASLSPDEALSWRLFDAMAKRSAMRWPFRNHDYIFDQMNGSQSRLPAFLINIHRVSDESQAADYVSRIEGMGKVLDTLTAESRSRADKGIMPPDWVYPYVISDIGNLLKPGESNAILDDFAAKVSSLDIADEAKMELVNASVEAWAGSAKPAFERLLAEMERQQAIAPTDDGIWRLPDGAAYYKALLANYTTTDLSADEIHAIGLREVERIHGEMRAIMQQVGFEGTLQEFFEHTRGGDQFFYTTREEYLADAQARLDAMEKKLPQYFGVLPKAPMVIKPVEAFREKSAGKAFYQSPAPDGSRPGTYYVNLYNLRDMSRNELEALAYHEGLPGHHLQRAIQTELGDVPPFRRFGGVTAYTEGWGLYSEELGKDMGFYTDPYSDFGRLGMELWRACRLVVDTGIHHKRWSREEAIQYLKDNTPNPDGDIRKAIERYIVYPGQATAYMIGKLKIMELRSRAQAELGEDFDIRAFHDTVLKSGPVPLSILEENVDAWIAGVKAQG
ncbi:DUF885 domain-containing protein [Parerythrobacter aestuarii]|uniref:DUF885 domain-containing protein n=1 Tax=Parerythrobacter aestuarii TaxID=3020909 RepID=UPI0024DE1C37|nr:DUF885 domain-containing protein [Parerythrobacter aestuarii]